MGGGTISCFWRWYNPAPFQEFLSGHDLLVWENSMLSATLEGGGNGTLQVITKWCLKAVSSSVLNLHPLVTHVSGSSRQGLAGVLRSQQNSTGIFTFHILMLQLPVYTHMYQGPE